jgi:hypothetical protein
MQICFQTSSLIRNQFCILGWQIWVASFLREIREFYSELQSTEFTIIV